MAGYGEGEGLMAIPARLWRGCSGGEFQETGWVANLSVYIIYTTCSRQSGSCILAISEIFARWRDPVQFRADL